MENIHAIKKAMQKHLLEVKKSLSYIKKRANYNSNEGIEQIRINCDKIDSHAFVVESTIKTLLSMVEQLGDEAQAEKPEQVDFDPFDEHIRGPKMSTDTGKIIFKYQMPVLEKFTMKLPKDAEIIRMEDQGGMFWLWAVVNTNAPLEERHFMAFKTGATIPEDIDLKYVGFCAVHVQMELGLYIFEVM